jgi:hypothetical protein
VKDRLRIRQSARRIRLEIEDAAGDAFARARREVLDPLAPMIARSSAPPRCPRPDRCVAFSLFRTRSRPDCAAPCVVSTTAAEAARTISFTAPPDGLRAANLPAWSAHDAARRGAGVFAVLQHLNPVDPHMPDAGRVLMRLLVSGSVGNGRGIERYAICELTGCAAVARMRGPDGLVVGRDIDSLGTFADLNQRLGPLTRCILLNCRNIVRTDVRCQQQSAIAR